MEKVSVIIPTYNRFNFLINTLNSIKQQTYKNIEIIVVNDCSNENEYYSYDWENQGIKIIHLEENSKKKFGYASPGYVRNKGIEVATGYYIAFCDDDDIWFPNKIEIQMNAINKTGCKMSCTDGLIGQGIYSDENKYLKYNEECFLNAIKKIYLRKKSRALVSGFPDIWTYSFLIIHNCIICSSVLVEKTLLNKIGNFSTKKPPGEDYETWLKILRYTNCIYLKDTCFYYDSNHGNGQNY